MTLSITEPNENMEQHIARSNKIAPPQPSTITPPHTPTALATSAHALLSSIHQIHSTLCTFPSLAPSPVVNTLLTQLVDLCIQSYPPSFSSYFFSLPSVSPHCTSLRPLCATAEGELESYWASQMLNLATQEPQKPRQEILDQFPYYANYVDLSRLECNTLATYLPIGTPLQSITFIGSGPLPLSSLCMLAHFPHATVWNVDRDARALHTSQSLCAALGYDRMEFVDTDVTQESAEQQEWMKSDVVFLAALVGEDTSSKIGILARLVGKLRVGTLVVARSARGMRG